MAVLLARTVPDAFPTHPGETVVLIGEIPRRIRRRRLIRPLRAFYVKGVFYALVEVCYVAADDPRLSFRVFIQRQTVAPAVPERIVFAVRVVIFVQELHRFIRSVVQHKDELRDIPSLRLHLQRHGEQDFRYRFIIIYGAVRLSIVV